jgi:hypothetical protein
MAPAPQTPPADLLVPSMPTVAVFTMSQMPASGKHLKYCPIKVLDAYHAILHGQLKQAQLPFIHQKACLGHLA